MLITINDKFQINVPQFTDEINNLKKLYTLNFQDKKLSKRKYTLLDNQIINSQNTDWNKAIALMVLNYKLLIHATLMQDEQGRRPFIKYQHRMTYVLEQLATIGLPAFINQTTTHYSLNTFIINSIKFTTNLFKQERDITFNNHEYPVDPQLLNKAIIEETCIEANQEQIAEQEDLKQIIKNLISGLDPVDQAVLELRYFIPRDSTLGPVSSYLKSGTKRTYAEVGQALNIDNQNARRLITNALRTIRHSTQTNVLEDYVDNFALKHHCRAKQYTFSW